MNTTPKIRILVPANPKKVGSMAHKRFALYRDGMTVSQFLSSGGTRADLHYDVDHKYIELTTLDTRPNGTSAQPNSNREAAVKRIKALLAKTEANGCTEEEAFAAALKAGELMDKYGIESSEAEIREETCITGIHGAERLKMHESKWVANAVGRYCDCRVWHTTRTGQIAFFGLPADVEVATYIMRVVEGAMNRSYKEFKKSDAYPIWDEARRVRTTFMSAMANRVNDRLDEMRKARHTEEMVTTTGTSLVLVKTQVVAEQFNALGMKLGKAKQSVTKYSNSAAAYEAGKAAGDKVHLGTGISGHTSKRIG